MSLTDQPQPFNPSADTAHVSSPLAWALAIAAQGFAVHPLQVRGKAPATPHGCKDATTHAEQIRAWWTVSPQANVGLAIPDGVLVVDIDPRNGGLESAKQILSDPARGLPNTRTINTGGGGFHLYYTVPTGLSFPTKAAPGIDLKQLGGYVVAPPSVHESGNVYSGAFNEALAPAPDWLVAIGRPRGAPLTPIQRNGARVETDGHNHEAVIALLAPHYREGQKHHMAVAIGGYYARRGYSLGDAERVVEALPSADTDARLKDAGAAFDMANPPGFSWLSEALPADVLAKLEALIPDVSLRARMIQDAVRSIERGIAAQGVAAANEPAPGTSYEQNNPMPAYNETRSDLGNARRLVRMHGHDLRYFAARKEHGWYIWDGARWKADDTGAAKRAAKAAANSLWDSARHENEEWRKFAAASLNRSRIENALALAQSEPGIPVTVDMLDAHPWLLNVQNGTLDLETGELRAPDRSLLMTKVCATPYVAHARSDLWDRFVARLTGGDAELAAYLQRAIGYALFGAWREKMFWFGYGDPDGGKSTFLGAVSDVLGDYAVAAAASTWMIQHNIGGNRGDITRLLGARLVTTLEVRPGARFDPEIMKKITGGDELVGAAKFENEIEFKPACALWFGANDRPIIPDDDEGFWSRVRCVPFTNVIPKAEQDKALKEKLASPEHAPAVLAWALAGCLAWQRDGIGSCAAVETATAAYRRDMNQAAGFFDERVEQAPGASVTVTELRAAYETWCAQNGVRKPLQGKQLGARLRKLGATGGDDASRVGGFRVWGGIRLKRD